jgi:hypothetical protein
VCERQTIRFRCLSTHHWPCPASSPVLNDFHIRSLFTSNGGMSNRGIINPQFYPAINSDR